MNTRRYMRVLTTLFAFLVIGSTRIWALSASDIIIDGGITNGTVAVKTGADGVKANADGSYTVTLVATPNNNYYITSRFIKVQKLVDPSAAPHKAPGIADFLPVSGSIVVGDGTKSGEFTFVVPSGYAGAHVTAEFQSTAGLVYIDGSTTASDITLSSGHYILTKDVDASIFENLYSSDFTGTLDGEFEGVLHKIDMSSSSNHALFNTIDGGVVKNVLLENVDVSIGNTNGDAGAICNVAKGNSRIYNCGILGTVEKTLTDNVASVTCSSKVTCTRCVGGLVGSLEGTSRVVNCFSFAEVSSGENSGNNGSYAGGIVGRNNVTSNANEVKTMVMNCMFYGNITSQTRTSPVYGGNEISNTSTTGLNNYNYYSYDKLIGKITDLNNALPAEEDYLNRYEFYRQLLNSNRRLAAWYVGDDAKNMAKWVLEKSDKSITDHTPYPYPILKSQGYYPSVINYDAEHAEPINENDETDRNKGKLLGTLSVRVNQGSGAPSGASITKSLLSLNRTDKDFDNYNFNYDKVQLPYYNEAHGKVVTGWKITSISGGTPGDYHAGDEFGGYNFADRNCTNKDLHSPSDRVFAQGAYFDVPYGVTGITIEPYWGSAAYVCDEKLDVVYNSSYGSPTGVLDNQFSFSEGKATGAFNGQDVYNSISGALNTLNGSKVYDNAIVLVGNLHLNAVPSSGSKAFTIMSVDMDKDNEPDYSLIYTHLGRDNGAVAPIRFDFINVPGLAMAQKPKGATKYCNVSIFKPKGWFEVTNTCNIYFSQFEYDNGGKSVAPLILQGGLYGQFVSTQKQDLTNKNTTYIHVGGNAWFKDFGNGTHGDGDKFTPHIPISVTGGDFDVFYLSGSYRPDAASNPDNAECYISGGRFGEAAGAGQQQIKGDVRWQIYNADITDFFGGGINADTPITGDIRIDITNSHVTNYYGGPKFGDMAGVDTETTSDDKTVTTIAEGCTFDKFFGAGYGGISYKRQKYHDKTDNNLSTWVAEYPTDKGRYFNGSGESNKLKEGTATYGYKGPGVATDFDYEFFVWSTGEVGTRFYVMFSSFSLAKTNDVSSTLKNCIIKGDYYGGGNLGAVNGKATSILENCTITGNVFGGGYSATKPKVPVRNVGFKTNPKNDNGVFDLGEKNDSVPYTLKYVQNGFDGKNNWEGAIDGSDIITDVDLSALGQVKETDVTIKGSTKVVGTVKIYNKTTGLLEKTELTGGVFGGGDASEVNGNTKVEILNTASDGINNVYGGGNTADVRGNTTVNLINGIINNDVFGGGNRGEVYGNVTVNMKSE